MIRRGHGHEKTGSESLVGAFVDVDRSTLSQTPARLIDDFELWPLKPVAHWLTTRTDGGPTTSAAAVPTRRGPWRPGPILSVFPALIVHSDLKSVHPGFPVAFIFKHKLINK